MKARYVWMLALTIPAAFVGACGGDDSGVNDGGSDGTVGDTGSGSDGSKQDATANDTGTGNDTGSGNDTGTGNDGGNATDGGNGNDGGTINDSGTTSFACTKPSDCTNGFCCGTIVFTGNGFQPNCTFVDASSACNATCKSNVSLQCQSTDTVRACAAIADCADAGTGYTDCCNVPFGDASAEFCWNKNLASFVNGATCL